MKKIISLVLVLCLVAAFAFASFKVGFQFGYGGLALNSTKDNNNKLNIGNGGWYAAAVGEYCISEGLTAKAELGANGLGLDSYRGTVGGTSISHKVVSEPSSLHFNAYAGLQFAFNLFGDIQLAVGGGADVMMGKEGSSTSDSVNIAFGPAGELALLLSNFGDNFMLFIGGKTAWYLINSDKALGTGYENLGPEPSISYMSYKFYAGMTYTF